MKKAMFFLVVFVVMGLVAGVGNVSAAPYPERAIEIIVPFGVGGGSDTAARAVAEGMKPLLKVPLVINNMSGGGGTKGMLYASQQPADGYTVLAITTSHLIDAVKPKTRAQLLRDFDPIMRIQWDTSAVTIAGDSKFKTLADLIEYGKKNPKMLKFAGTSPGGWSEIQTVAFFKGVGVDATFVPFDSGAEIKAAILGGHIHGAVEELAETLPLIEAGKLRSLAVIMEKRHPALPNVPCTAELGFNYTHGLMRAWGVKKGTPPDRIQYLHDVIKKALDVPIYKKFVQDNHLYARPGYLGPEETRKYWDDEVKFFTETLKTLGYVK
ncbi:MAG: tripartite tricarboxylate transporter substrate binding protein [Proteobacteria bacterium]|nr:tripartite tricarboxylate transporter substrate binding protein [Pseudomonadota bacterium]MCG2740623.1 tripartite tricarboxylate transporter substrate binding protein [Syntrophaceae bacterium]MBU1745759.1 tripartite tricarboxylate transporter substrate binding protein [Pseudomonadota bacterium]MBU1966118.1 tripartite tricarboxylate transporter substrate binding protein [Pseudomonadota bacterium]MBU4370703.1 tripartite tricarboxylate transporter substrate binding protein [Pseudomonadota bacte